MPSCQPTHHPPHPEQSPSGFVLTHRQRPTQPTGEPLLAPPSHPPGPLSSVPLAGRSSHLLTAQHPSSLARGPSSRQASWLLPARVMGDRSGTPRSRPRGSVCVPGLDSPDGTREWASPQGGAWWLRGARAALQPRAPNTASVSCRAAVPFQDTHGPKDPKPPQKGAGLLPVSSPLRQPGGWNPFILEGPPYSWACIRALSSTLVHLPWGGERRVVRAAPPRAPRPHLELRPLWFRAWCVTIQTQQRSASTSVCKQPLPWFPAVPPCPAQHRPLHSRRRSW